MKLFECQHCGQPLYFENTKCVSCGHSLGYLPKRENVSALEEDGVQWRALAEPQGRYRYCANAAYDVCNWLISADSTENYCAACRHNRTIPDLTQPENVAHWQKIELAKHRLFYTLLRLRLPLETKAESPDGLAFDFLQEPGAFAPSQAPVMTGHVSGVITLNLAEADDSERERQRHAMGEPYRTLLGHFRHESSHYYWDRLIRNSPNLAEFRRVFGDETQDYGEALKQHYANGAPADWPEWFVTSYASSHPWEDFAETWAHYFHIVDTLETANAFGIRVRPQVAKGSNLTTAVDFDPHVAAIDRIVDAWLPLTFAMNSINRSMGLQDLYPFVLAPTVISKLSFVHSLIHGRGDQNSKSRSDGTLRAIIAGFKRRVGAPDPR
jgi:hypothetical protein